MGSNNSTQQQQQQAASGDTKPACKICCACPTERRARDECTLLRNMNECETEISAFYACLLKEGFSKTEVDALRKNTKQM